MAMSSSVSPIVRLVNVCLGVPPDKRRSVLAQANEGWNWIALRMGSTCLPSTATGCDLQGSDIAGSETPRTQQHAVILAGSEHAGLLRRAWIFQGMDISGCKTPRAQQGCWRGARRLVLTNGETRTRVAPQERRAERQQRVRQDSHRECGPGGGPAGVE